MKVQKHHRYELRNLFQPNDAIFQEFISYKIEHMFPF